MWAAHVSCHGTAPAKLPIHGRYSGVAWQGVMSGLPCRRDQPYISAEGWAKPVCISP